MLTKMTTGQVEWAEHLLSHEVNEVKKDKPVETIAIRKLEAKTAIAQELIDFFQRLLKEDDQLKSLEISNFQGLD